jgi:hypothetical protein
VGRAAAATAPAPQGIPQTKAASNEGVPAPESATPPISFTPTWYPSPPMSGPAPTSTAPPPASQPAYGGPTVAARKQELYGAPLFVTPVSVGQPRNPATAPDATAHLAEVLPSQTEVLVEPAPTEPTPAERAARPTSGPPTPHVRVRQCKRCGFYLKPTALNCPACGRWRGRAYALLTASLLLLALLGVLAVVWLPRFKFGGPPAQVAPEQKTRIEGSQARLF